MRSSVFFKQFVNNYSEGIAICKICNEKVNINSRSLHIFYNHNKIYVNMKNRENRKNQMMKNE